MLTLSASVDHLYGKVLGAAGKETRVYQVSFPSFPWKWCRSMQIAAHHVPTAELPSVATLAYKGHPAFLLLGHCTSWNNYLVLIFSIRFHKLLQIPSLWRFLNTFLFILTSVILYPKRLPSLLNESLQIALSMKTKANDYIISFLCISLSKAYFLSWTVDPPWPLCVSSFKPLFWLLSSYSFCLSGECILFTWILNTLTRNHISTSC